MDRHLRRLGWLMIGFLWMILWGCASTPSTRFYVLSPIHDPAKTQPAGGDRCPAIGIGPVRLPAYLDRPGIVTRVTPNELRVGEFDKWSEALEGNFSRVLAENIRLLLCTKIVSPFPWKGSVPVDYRVDVEVIRMDGIVAQSAVLDVIWTIVDGSDKKKRLMVKRATYEEPTGTEDYGAFVSAQSRNLGGLSREIAQAVKDLHR